MFFSFVIFPSYRSDPFCNRIDPFLFPFFFPPPPFFESKIPRRKFEVISGSQVSETGRGKRGEGSDGRAIKNAGIRSRLEQSWYDYNGKKGNQSRVTSVRGDNNGAGDSSLRLVGTNATFDELLMRTSRSPCRITLGGPVVNLLPGSRCKSISAWTIHQCDGSRRKSNVYEDECALKLYSPPRANAII